MPKQVTRQAPENVQVLERLLERVSQQAPEQAPDQWSEALARNVRSVVTALLPAGAKVLLASDSGRTSPIDGLAVKPFRPEATAAELDINRTTLYKKMRKYRLDVGEAN